MPYTAKQRRLLYADKDRAEQGEKTVTGLGAAKLAKMAKEPLKKPGKKGKKS